MKKKFIVGYFDKESEDFVKDIWMSSEDNFCRYVEGNRPHMTFFDIEDENMDTGLIEDIISREYVFDLTVGQLGTFFNSGVLYYHPTVTQELVAFHQECFEFIREYMSESSLYAPGVWIPHITIDIDMDTDEMLAMLKKLYVMKAFEVQVTQMALIEVTFENNKPIHSKDVFTIDLKQF